MRTSVFSLLLIVISLGCSGVQKSPLQVESKWVGSYLCPQGPTDLVLKILDNNPTEVRAIFEFSHVPSGSRGSYHLHGTYSSSTKQLKFKPGSWIHRPSYYEAVGMEGTVSQDEKTYEGKISHPNCGNFKLTQFK